VDEEELLNESSQHLPPEALDRWVEHACDHAGVPREAVPVADVLDLARDVAHHVARPAAPVTAYLAGLLAGRAATAEDAAAAVAGLASLARAYDGKGAAG
jgi:hypothetical protein